MVSNITLPAAIAPISSTTAGNPQDAVATIKATVIFTHRRAMRLCALAQLLVMSDFIPGRWLFRRNVCDGCSDDFVLSFLPIDPDDVKSIMESYHTSRITRATGIASGPGRGLKAAQLALVGLSNIRDAGWLLIDVNVHADESDALAVYDAAVNHVHPLANDNMDILCGLRMDCDVVDRAVVTIVSGE